MRGWAWWACKLAIIAIAPASCCRFVPCAYSWCYALIWQCAVCCVRVWCLCVVLCVLCSVLCVRVCGLVGWLVDWSPTRWNVRASSL
jgi:hypothetical protein